MIETIEDSENEIQVHIFGFRIPFTLDQPFIIDKNSRVEVIVLIPETTDHNESSQADLLAKFKQAWHEAMTGQIIPTSQLWEGLENN